MPEEAAKWRERGGGGVGGAPESRGPVQHGGRSLPTVSDDPVDGCSSPPVPSEQVLHLWLEVLCSSLPTVEKWYQPWSFLRSPGWVQIKCELR